MVWLQRERGTRMNQPCGMLREERKQLPMAYSKNKIKDDGKPIVDYAGAKAPERLRVEAVFSYSER